MALDNKLKSEMASGAFFSDQSRTAFVPDSTDTRPVFESSAQGKNTDDEKGSHNKAFVAEPIDYEKAHNSNEVLLKSIEKQLKSLNQSVADLEQEVSACRNPDYRVIFSKIDSARNSIEKLLLEATVTQSSSNDSCIVEKISKLEEQILAVIEKQDRNDRKLTQTLRENANFQIQVRQGMQKDIDTYKEQQSGEQFNPILKEIATMYVEYQSLLEDESISDLSRKNLKALFEQIEDLLADYDAVIIRSEIGDTRQTRSTKIIRKIPVAAKDKHNTIAMSRKPGVIRGRIVLYPEFVDVFVYDSTIIPEDTSNIVSEDLGTKQNATILDDEITKVTDATTPLNGDAECEPIMKTEVGALDAMKDKGDDEKDKDIIAESADKTNG